MLGLRRSNIRSRVLWRSFNVLVVAALLMPATPTVDAGRTLPAVTAEPMPAAMQSVSVPPAGEPMSASYAPLASSSDRAEDADFATARPERQAAPPSPIDLADVDPVAGGNLVSSDGKIGVRFPSGAAAERLIISYQTQRNSFLRASQMIRRFALHAYAPDRQDAPVRRFQRPVEIVFRYTAEDVRGLNVASLRLAYRDEATGEWVAVPTEVDPVARTATAHVDHFTDYNLNADPNISGPGLVQGFQTSLFSGTATAEYPIELPPGPGGFKPDLNLTYNSGRVDEMHSDLATASWVGLGWELGLGRISYDEVSGKRFLQMNGAGYQLLQATGGSWHTKSESYYQIAPISDGGGHVITWQVRDRSGNYYEFGGADADGGTSSRQYYSNLDGEHYYRWDLNLMRDSHGNEIRVKYSQTWLTDIYGNPESVRAAYPSTVTYGDVEVKFYKLPSSGWRPDIPPENTPLVVEVKYLDRIEVKVAGELVRLYDFSYEFEDADYTCAGGCHWYAGEMRLTSLVQKGSDGASTLPAMTFAYGELPVSYPDSANGTSVFHWSHLITTTNGYGGSVVYGYAEKSISIPDQWTREAVVSKAVSSGFADTQTTTYSYSWGPSYLVPGIPGNWYGAAEFRGFQYAKSTDWLGNTAGHYFYTTRAGTNEEDSFATDDANSEALSGREYLTNYKAGGTDLVQVVSQAYYSETISGKIKFVGLQQRDVTQGTKTSRTTYEYDSYGNVAYARDYDHLGNLYRYRQKTYHPNTTKRILDRPATEKLFTAAGELVEGAWYLYDGATIENSVPITGDLTMVRRFSSAWSDAGATGWRTTDISYTYDSYGNRTSEVSYPQSGYVYQTTSGQEWGTSPGGIGGGATVAYTYDVSSTFPLTLTYPISAHGQESKTYGKYAKVETETDVNGALTSYDYDVFGQLLKVYRPGESEEAGNTATITHTYDYAASPVKVTTQRRTDAGGAGTPAYHTTIGYYDGLGRLIQQKVEAGSGNYVETSVSYDGAGRKYQQSAPVFSASASYSAPNWGSLKKTTYTYDMLDRTRVVTGTDGVAITTTYTDWTTKVVDGNGHCRQSDRDAFGRTVEVREYSGVEPSCTLYATTGYAYDARDLLAGVTDAAGAPQTSISYDLLGRKVSTDDPDMGVWSYRYDARGNLRQQRDARGVDLLFDYDAENRLTSKGTAALEQISPAQVRSLRLDANALRRAAGVPDHAWTEALGAGVKVRAAHFQELRNALREIPGFGNIQYAAGDASSTRVMQASDLADLRHWIYGDEAHGREMSQTASFAYDSTAGGNKGRGRRTSSGLTAGGYSAAVTYDQRGRATGDTVAIEGVSYPTDYAYNAADQPTRVTYPDVAAEVVDIGYSARLLPTSLGGYVSDVSYNAPGRPETVVNGAAVTTTYAYDANSFRLSAIGFAGTGAPSLSLGYGYDNAGNVSAITETGTTTNFSYDHLDRLTGAANGYSATYEYDVLGDLQTKTEAGITRTLTYNLSTRPKHAAKTVDGVTQVYDANGNLTSDGTRKFSYDAENRLTEVVSGTNTVQFFYDPDGKRYKKVEGGQSTIYIGKHYEKTGTTETKYYQFLGQPIAMNQGGTTTYLYRDQLGSTSADSNGGSRSYWPYGDSRATSGAVSTDRLYTGQRLDPFGLYDYRARQYDPVLGRFISPDSIVPQPGNPQDLNRYAYGHNNPLRFTDSSGHFPVDPLGWLIPLIFVPPPALPQQGGFPHIFVDNRADSTPYVTKGVPSTCESEGFPGKDGVIKFPDFEAASVKIGKNPDQAPRQSAVGSEPTDGEPPSPKPIQNHHFIPNGNGKWTPMFEEITDKYGLDLNSA